MSIFNDSQKMQLWHRIVIEISRDAKLQEQFVQDPSTFLVSKGLITPDQTVIIRTRDVNEQSYDVLIYTTSPTDGDPEILTLPASSQLIQYFEKLPKPPGTILAGPGCAIPGGCSTI